MTRKIKSDIARKSAACSGIAALLAFISCNGLTLLAAILAVFGIALSISPHVQAVVISLFSALAPGFMFIGYMRHRRRGPLLLATLGALVIIATMYIAYSKPVESVGLLALVIAAGWNWYVTRRKASDTRN